VFILAIRLEHIWDFGGQTYARQHLRSASRRREYPRFEISAMLEAWREGRPYSGLPPDHAVALLRPPPEPEDVMSPGGRLMQQMEGLRQRMANDKDVTDFDALRRDMVRQIEQEQGDAERQQRQRLKRQGRAERKRQTDAYPSGHYPQAATL
jgi:hypothetical protein